MPKYTVDGTHIKHDGEVYGPGDTIELSEEQAEKLSVKPFEEPQKEPAKEQKKGKGPEDPKERIAAIKEAISQLDPENREHWNKDKSPNVEVIEGVLGYNISSVERNQAWIEYQGEKEKE